MFKSGRVHSNSQIHKRYTNILTTALSQTKPILSSTPLVPSGIRVKSSLPIAFWEVLYVQWALPTTWRSPLHQGNKMKKNITAVLHLLNVVIFNLEFCNALYSVSFVVRITSLWRVSSDLIKLYEALIHSQCIFCCGWELAVRQLCPTENREAVPFKATRFQWQKQLVCLEDTTSYCSFWNKN